MTPLARFFRRISFCAKVGALAGSFSAGLFTAIQFASTGFTFQEALITGAILALGAWLFVLLIVGVLLRYGITQIALITLIICLLTSVGIAILLHSYPLPRQSLVVGFVLGLIIGEIICRICTLLTRGIRKEHRHDIHMSR